MLVLELKLIQMNNYKHLTLTLVLVLYTLFTEAQQNNSMFLMHQLPESNLLNPAIKTPCKWYVGIPVLSSLHVNYANNMFSYNNLITSTGEGTYEPDIENAVKQLHWRNYIGTEVHTQWLAIGHNYRDYSLTFTITEKNNFPLTLPREALELVWQGNSQFEGETVSLKGTGLYFKHYREYALSVSKPTHNGGRWGIRAKLLFGKLNIATRSTNIDITTDENSFDLNFKGDLLIHSSLPIIVDVEDNIISNVSYDESVSTKDLLLNRKNPGFAIDLGYVYPYSDKIELSASIIDLGFIRWRSNLNTFDGNGDFKYEGVVDDNIEVGDGYFNHLSDAFMDSMKMEVYQKKYTTFLPTQIMLGANYKINYKFSAGLVGNMQIYRTKLIPSLTLMSQYELLRNIHIMASYTAQLYSLKQVGLGLVYGKSPVQFYVISDNIVGLIWPLSAQRANLRFGFNLIFGCGKDKNKRSPSNKYSTCFGMEQTNQKKYMKKVKKRKHN